MLVKGVPGCDTYIKRVCEIPNSTSLNEFVSGMIIHEDNQATTTGKFTAT